jgi:hypothetical protein
VKQMKLFMFCLVIPQPALQMMAFSSFTAY